MRSIFIMTVCLSLPVLSGCRLAMRGDAEVPVVETHPVPESTGNETEDVATASESEEAVVGWTETASVSEAEVLAAHEAPIDAPGDGWHATSNRSEIVPTGHQVPAAAVEESGTNPLNLTTALQLAGGNNLQIALADERIRAAVAKLDAAQVLWLPSLNGGAGFNSHTGQIQATSGEVVEVDRQSVFVGGGPNIRPGPLAGGAGGPMRMMASLSVVDAWFEPLAEQQIADATESDHTAVYSDTLYDVTVAWLNLQSAQSELAIAREAVEHADRLAELTREFATAGAGLEADALRAEAALADRQQASLSAAEQRDVASAELARLLRLPPETPLHAVDARPVPMEIVDAGLSLSELISQGVTHRPEVHSQHARLEAAKQRATQERLRPWLPSLTAGLSAGGFGGGPDSEFSNLSDRVDIDALAIWELRNLGFGNAAMLAERESQQRQESLTLESFQDQVAAEVAQTFSRVKHRRGQIDVAASQLEAAEAALPLNFEGIVGKVLRPIEALQAINNLATARRRYLQAVVGYNTAQFALLRAIGEPPQQ